MKDSGGSGRRGKKKSRVRTSSDGGPLSVERRQQGRRGKNEASAEDDASFPVVSDSRFSSMHSAPAFQRVKADEGKVLLDDRFKAVLTDPRFQVSSAKVDKYGRKVSKASKQATSQLRAFYKVEQDAEKGEQVEDVDEEEDYDDDDDEEEEDDGDEEDDDGIAEEHQSGNDQSGNVKDSKRRRDKKTSTREGEEEGAGEDVDEKERPPARTEESRQAYLTRLSRGEVSDLSSSDGDTSDDDADVDDLDSDGGTRAGLDDPTTEAVPLAEGSTRRLAVTNCDWDHIRAKDLMVLCGSFCPPSARLLSVTVFPSDFGQEMMKVEAAAGPHAALEGANKNFSREDNDGQEQEAAEEGATVTEAGTAVGGRVVKRRKPGVIIEDYRTTACDGEEEEDPKKAGMDDDEATEVDDKNAAAGFDPEKLRVYELRKLKYYFAVLECDSAEAAETIYREVDGMEFEHSSVALDLRFVPDEISFEGRTVRDRSASVPSSYQPPSFICKALQQTRVECTWDEVSSDRQALLGRVSQWRDAAEEDFEAYLASSSEESSVDGESSDENSGEDEEEQTDDCQTQIGREGETASGDRKKEKKQRQEKASKAFSEKAKRARRLLLAGALGSGSEESQGDLDGEADEDEDDDDSEGDAEFSYASKASASGEAGLHQESDSEFTFVPRDGGAGPEGGGLDGLLARRREKEALARETPWEATLRKERERKQARKKAIKEKMNVAKDLDGEASGGDDDFFVEEAQDYVGRGGRKKSKKKKQSVSQQEGGGVSASMGTLGAEDEEDDRRDYDMHQLAREEKMKGKKLRGKRKRKEEAKDKAPGQDFKVDVSDERFAAVLEGDTRFGIDRTDTSFKNTEGMRQILQERGRRKDRQNANGHDQSNGSLKRDANNHNNDHEKKGDDRETTHSNGNLSSLVSKLKTRGLSASATGLHRSDRSVGGGGGIFNGEGRVGQAPERVAGSVGGEDEVVATGRGGGSQGRRGKKKRRKA